MSYAYQYVSQTSQTENLVINPGETYPVTIKLKNTGTDTWYKTGTNPVRLGTSHSQDRASGFYDSATWMNNGNKNRIEMQETSVATNAIATFTFGMKPTDDLAGAYNEYFQPVVEGLGWFNDINMYLKAVVPAPVGTFLFTWYTSGTFGWDNDPDSTVVAPDTPTGGRYDSASTTVIRRQLQQISDAGFKFVVIDYWDDGPYATITKANFALVVALMESEFPNLRFAPLVEPAYGVTTNHVITSTIYNTLYSAYGTSPCAMKYKGKNLVMTFCKRLGGTDSRFWQLSMCNGNEAGYSMNYWSVPAAVNNRLLSIINRFDNSLVTGTTHYSYNKLYRESLPNDQCAVAMNNRDGIDLLFFTAWNEYRERTNLEPHSNPDSTVADDAPYKAFQSFILNQWQQ